MVAAMVTKPSAAMDLTTVMTSLACAGEIRERLEEMLIPGPQLRRKIMTRSQALGI